MIVSDKPSFTYTFFVIAGVRNILPFRISNRDVLEPVWNHEHIEYVEIALKETLDVKGNVLQSDSRFDECIEMSLCQGYNRTVSFHGYRVSGHIVTQMATLGWIEYIAQCVMQAYCSLVTI